MMRRSVFRFAFSAGNGIIGIRREDKNVWERRCPLTPDQVRALLKEGTVKKCIVQPSTIRCFDDREFADAGAEINEDLSEASTICAVKEVPSNLLISDRTYMFFTHTIKAQPHNMPLLDTMLEKNVRTIDYERIVGADGRLVKFGPYAGFAGMMDTLHGLGLALLTRGYATPFLHLSLSKEYRSLENARKDLAYAGDLIRERGLPKELCPLTIAVTGAGSVSLAAQQMLHLLPCKYVQVEDLPGLWKKENQDRNCIHVVVVRAKDMVVPKDPSRRFESKHYYQHPDEYMPVFHETVAPYIHVLVNGMYWEPRFPRLLTTRQARHMLEQDRLPMLVLGDITCDIGGSVEFFVKGTEIQNPFYVYDLLRDNVTPIQDYKGEGVIVLGVDHLPAEFPREASTSFGSGLSALVKHVAVSPDTAPLAEQEKALGPELFNAVVTNKGALTPNFKYIAQMRAQNEKFAPKKRNVVMIGAGMTAGPCVEYLLSKGIQVTLVDSKVQNLNQIRDHYFSEADMAKYEHLLFTVVGEASPVSDNVATLIRDTDCVVSLVPAYMHPEVAKVTIALGKPLVTASYVSDGMLALAAQAEKAGVMIINEIGLDPGIDIMTTAEMLSTIRREGGVVTHYVSLCGALPQPQNTNGPLAYKFSWSPRGVLLACSRPTRFRVQDQWFDVAGKYLYYFMMPITSFGGLAMEWVPNGDSGKYSEQYELTSPAASACVRGTIRYPGYGRAVRVLMALGLLDQAPLDILQDMDRGRLTWANLMEAVLDRAKADANPCLKARARAFALKQVTAIQAEVDALPAMAALRQAHLLGPQPASRLRPNIVEDVDAAISDLADLGLFSNDNVPRSASGAPIDSLCETMLRKMSYRPHERDFVIMMHRVTAAFPDGKKKVYEATLAMAGASETRTATAVTVGVPVAITADLVVSHELDRKKHKGLLYATMPEIYRPVLRELATRGIRMRETVTELSHESA